MIELNSPSHIDNIYAPKDAPSRAHAAARSHGTASTPGASNGAMRSLSTDDSRFSSFCRPLSHLLTERSTCFAEKFKCVRSQDGTNQTARRVDFRCVPIIASKNRSIPSTGSRERPRQGSPKDDQQTLPTFFSLRGFASHLTFYFTLNSSFLL